MSDQVYLKQLQAQVQQGKRFKYVCFWGHTQKTKTTIDKSCLSQWFPARFEVDAIVYKTAEQYMMAGKAKVFNDMDIFEKIIQTSDPKEIKALGRLVKNYHEDIWQKHRFDIVVQANIAKFSQNLLLQQFLINTGDKVLVEASPVDKIWGIGLTEQDSYAEKPL